MSRKSVVGIIIVLLVFIGFFSAYIYLRTNPQRKVSTSELFAKLPDSQISKIFVREDTASYVNLRGILTSKSTKSIQIAANTGESGYTSYEISDKTRMICLDKKLENSWLDFNVMLDNHRALDKYPEKYVAHGLNSLDISGMQQVMFSKSKNTSFPDILWVIGCL